MNTKKGAIPIYLALVILVIGGVLAVGTAYLVSNRKTVEKSSAAFKTPLPTQVGIGNNNLKTPKPTPFPTPTSTPNPGLVQTETGTTANGWSYTGYRDVLVDVVTSSDKHTLYIDFEHKNFNTIASITYKLTYTKTDGTSVGVEGTIKPASEKLLTKANGNKYTRKEISLSSCSQSVCTFHENNIKYILVVKTQRVSSEGTTYEQRLTKASL